MIRKPNYTPIAILVVGVLFLGPVFLFAQPLSPRTLIVAGDLDAQPEFPLLAYTIVDDRVVHADTQWAPTRDSGPIGLALDLQRNRLFVSYKQSTTLDAFDASSFEPTMSATMVGVPDLTAIAVHSLRGHLFTAGLGSHEVYVLDTESMTLIDQWTLPTGNGAWGMDILGDWLFVADATQIVRYYQIDSAQEEGSLLLPDVAVDIAVTDHPEPTVYTTAFDGGTSLSPYLTRTELDSGTSTQVLLGAANKGIALNPEQELAYVVVDHSVTIVDVQNMTVIDSVPLNPQWTATDTVAGLLPYRGHLEITDLLAPDGDYKKGDLAALRISVVNRHNRPIHTLPVSDVYDPEQMSFGLASHPANDNLDDGRLDWNDLIVAHGQDLLPGETIVVKLYYTVATQCEGLLYGANTATVTGALDDQGQPVLDMIGIFETTIDCRCEKDIECDDGLFCNGREICTEQGACRSPGNPCENDDGIFCNGEETGGCDEASDGCEHSGDPCGWEMTCVEETDLCASPDDDDAHDDDSDPIARMQDDDGSAGETNKENADSSCCG